jgi:hypothetical protein
MSNSLAFNACLKQKPANLPVSIATIERGFDASPTNATIEQIWDSSLGVYSHLSGELQSLKERVSKLERGANACSVKIYDLASDMYNLKFPVDVILRIVDDEILALIPELELRGEGVIEAEALTDLKNELIDLFEYLNTIQDKNLGKSPRRWKKIINSFVEKQDGD